MADVFDLVAKITLDTSKYDSKLDTSSKKFSNFGAKVKTGLATGAKIAGVFAGAAAGAAAAIYKVSTKAATAADHIDKMSQKIGISREAYQELDFICSQSGANVDNLRIGMKTLTNQMGRAASGTGNAADMFNRLGLSIYDSNGNMKSQEQMLWETLDALQGVENQTERATLANTLFGKSGSDLMPLINGARGSIADMRQEAHDLGLVMSDEGVDAGVKLTDTIDKAKRSFEAITNQIGINFMPIIQTALDFILEHMPEIQTVVSGVFDVLGGIVNTAVGIIQTYLIPAFSGIVDFIKGTLAPGLQDGFQNRIQPVIETVFGRIKDVWENVLKPVFNSIWTFLQDTVLPNVQNIWENGILPVISSAFTAIQSVWENVLKPVWDGLYTLMTEHVIPVLKDKWENDIQPTLETVFGLISQIYTDVLAPVFTNLYEFISDTLAPAFKTVFEEGILPLLTDVFNGIATIWDETLSPAFEAIRSFIEEKLAPAFSGFGEKVTDFKDNVLKPAAEFIAGKFLDAFKDLRTFWQKQIQPKLETLHEKFMEFKDKVLDPVATFIKDTFVKAFEKVKEIFEGVKEKLKPLKTAFETFKRKTLDPIATFVSDTFHGAFKKVGDFFDEHLVDIVQGVGDKLSWLWNDVLTPVGDYVGGAFSTAFDTLQGVFDGLITFITGVFSGDWQQAWDGISSIFGSVWDGFVELAKTPINLIIGLINNVIGGIESALNAVIGGLNSIQVTIPDWVPFFGGDTFGINISKVNWGRIQPLAGGGILGEGGRAIVGEKGLEYLSVMNGHAFVSPVGGRQEKNLSDGRTQNFVFNIYTQPGQNEEQVARAVQRQFVAWENQRKAAYV